MVRGGLLVLALVGCGRLGFDPAPTDDASASAAGDDAPRACAFDLCELFEAPALDTSLWTIDPMVTRDSSIAHRGAASARMHVDALAANQAATVALTESRTFEGASRDLWVRGWLRLSALPAGTNELELIGFAQASGAATANAVFVRADQVGLLLLFDGATAAAPIALPLDTWFCLLLHVRLAPSGGAIHLESDLFAGGPDISNATTDTMPPISVLRFGPRFTAAKVAAQQPSLDVWLDDLIVHSAPVSCAD